MLKNLIYKFARSVAIKHSLICYYMYKYLASRDLIRSVYNLFKFANACQLIQTTLYYIYLALSFNKI